MPGDALTTGILVVMMVAAFYFLIIRPQRRRQSEQQKILKQMEPGSRVMLSAGIYGTLVNSGDKQALVELAPGVEVTVLKQVIVSVVTPDSPYAEDSDAGEDSDAVEEETADEDKKAVETAATTDADESGPADTDKNGSWDTYPKSDSDKT